MVASAISSERATTATGEAELATINVASLACSTPRLSWTQLSVLDSVDDTDPKGAVMQGIGCIIAGVIGTGSLLTPT